MRASVGILGGTFDPIHLGHIASALEVAEAYAMERVLLMLSARPPHKPDHHPAPVADRLAMMQLAVDSTPRLEVSDLEAMRPGPSYMVDTLTRLSADLPSSDLALIVGIDAYREIDSWHRAGDLLALADLIVTSRPDADTEEHLEPPIAARNACCYDSEIGRYRHNSGHTLSYHSLASGLAISASAIRRLVGQGSDVAQLVGPAVARYIEEKGLYPPTL